MYPFADKHGIRQQLGISATTLKQWRLTGQITEGQHYVRVGPRTIRYNVRLLEDFMVNRHEPELHEMAIRNYLAQLPSSERVGRQRRLKAV